MSKKYNKWLEGWEARGSFKIGSSTLRGLSRNYQMDHRSLKKLLKPIEKKLGDKPGYLYNPRQVLMIVQYLGAPGILAKKPGSNDHK